MSNNKAFYTINVTTPFNYITPRSSLAEATSQQLNAKFRYNTGTTKNTNNIVVTKIPRKGGGSYYRLNYGSYKMNGKIYHMFQLGNQNKNMSKQVKALQNTQIMSPKPKSKSVRQRRTGSLNIKTKKNKGSNSWFGFGKNL